MRKLEEIERDANAATPGPWVREGDRIGVLNVPRKYGPHTGRVTMTVVTCADGPDAVFIAAARTDVPDLLAEVRRLRGLLGEACDIIDGGGAYCGDCDRGMRAHDLRSALRGEP